MTDERLPLFVGVDTIKHACKNDCRGSGVT